MIRSGKNYLDSLRDDRVIIIGDERVTDPVDTDILVTMDKRVCGDQNDDGVANILDVIIDLQIAVELIEPTPIQEELSDLNQDGNVDVVDAIIGLQHIVGQIPTLDQCGT